MNVSLNKMAWDLPRIKEGKIPKKLDPKLMEFKGKTLFYSGREVVLDDKRKQEILANLFESPDTPYGMNAL